MSALVDQITAVQRAHHRMSDICKCREWEWQLGYPADSHDRHVAERVAESLGLTEETRSQSTYKPDDPWATSPQRRWVSAWSEVQS
jgi:hypothetical protein